MLVVFESTVVMSRRRNMEDLRRLKPPAMSLLVRRMTEALTFFIFLFSNNFFLSRQCEGDILHFGLIPLPPPLLHPPRATHAAAYPAILDSPRVTCDRPTEEPS